MMADSLSRCTSNTISPDDLTIGTLNSIVQSMEAKMSELQAAWMVAAQSTGGGGSPTMGKTVRYKKCIYTMLEQVGRAREFIYLLLAVDTAAGRPKLKEVFGDCTHIAMIHVFIDTLSPMLEGSNLAEDGRLQQCHRACDSVEGVLRDAGLSDRLAEARQQAAEHAEQLAQQTAESTKQPAPTSTSTSTSTSASSINVPVFKAKPPRQHRRPSGEEVVVRAKMLEEIDAAKTAENAVDLVDELFHVYDRDGSGVLQGEEYDKVLKDLTAHILREAQERKKRLGMSFLPPEEILHQWVVDVVDPNHDGAITLEEARIGFRKAVNDVK
eukprot:CAMPEP_0206452848 /NCGR_PEP_ID=MMETSP0324_2-20121206/20190_1 /ASSEMBLY_ACC=CAM_ASM_000836 /TAXON_ID=2866 /ORGANISM="Crypthecodinium cohnii, Strain Seligo" /LENGTH=325 /DNA_ID=CAMNT_0053923017 /DNA_START=55 /DNA_END=1032 /DNA_ORIENTATION=+